MELKNPQHQALRFFLILLLAMLAGGCHYRIRTVQKNFYIDESSWEKERLLRRQIAGRPYIYLLSKGDVYQLDKAVYADGTLSGQSKKVSKWLYPIPERTRKEELPIELENHGHFEKIIYLEVDENVKEGHYVLNWEKVMTYSYYK